MARDEFTQKEKDILAKRVGYMCSNPECGKHTSGPHINNNKATTIGVAAHITAASENGPRYDKSITSKERGSIENAIWLCENCAKLIDKNPEKYSYIKLFNWKGQSELRSYEQTGKSTILSYESEKHIKEIYKKINKHLKNVMSHYEYFYKYFNANFSNCLSYVEVQDSIERYNALHEEPMMRSNELFNSVELIRVIIDEDELDIDKDIVKLINQYILTTSFVFQSDGNVGLYNNWTEKFFKNINEMHSTRLTLFDEISIKIRDVY